MGNDSKTYKVNVAYVFEGVFFIKAESLEQAQRFAVNHCGATLGGGIESTLPYDDVDWEFNIHPEKVIMKRSGR